jgi:hypothetical protein
MANPNIVGVTSIFGKTVSVALTTSEQTILTNSAASNKVFKVNVIFAANIDGAAAADVTVRLHNGTTSFPIAHTLLVPADATLLVTDKSASFYLEENWSIRALASAAGDIQLTVSYEEIA